jgi:hypothetical protein
MPLRKRAPEGKATARKNAEKRAGADGARTAKENGLSPPRYLKKRFKQKTAFSRIAQTLQFNLKQRVNNFQEKTRHL